MENLLSRYPSLRPCANDIEQAKDAMAACYKNGGKILLCGNGGSSADCDHIVGELMKGFLKSRPLSKELKERILSASRVVSEDELNKLQGGLPAISLTSMSALNSAFCNDSEPDMLYAQSLLALARPNDLLIAISTSGNAKNVLYATAVAKGIGIKTVALTGDNGGELKSVADVCICAPERETYKVQELHLPIYHYLCAEIEKLFFGK